MANGMSMAVTSVLVPEGSRPGHMAVTEIAGTVEAQKVRPSRNRRKLYDNKVKHTKVNTSEKVKAGGN